MSFRLIPKSVTLHDLEQRNGRCFAKSVAFGAHCVKVVEDVVAISFPGEFLVLEVGAYAVQFSHVF